MIILSISEISAKTSIHLSDAKTDPFITLGPDISAYLKNIGIQIKEKKTGKTAIGFGLLFGNIQGRKGQFVILALFQRGPL